MNFLYDFSGICLTNHVLKHQIFEDYIIHLKLNKILYHANSCKSEKIPLIHLKIDKNDRFETNLYVVQIQKPQ